MRWTQAWLIPALAVLALPSATASPIQPWSAAIETAPPDPGIEPFRLLVAGDVVIVREDTRHADEYRQGRLVAFDVADGKERWSLVTAAYGYVGVAADEKQAYVLDGVGGFRAVDLASGVVRWTESLPTDATPVIPPVVSGGKAMVFMKAPWMGPSFWSVHDVDDGRILAMQHGDCQPVGRAALLRASLVAPCVRDLPRGREYKNHSEPTANLLEMESGVVLPLGMRSTAQLQVSDPMVVAHDHFGWHGNVSAWEGTNSSTPVWNFPLIAQRASVSTCGQWVFVHSYDRLGQPLPIQVRDLRTGAANSTFAGGRAGIGCEAGLVLAYDAERKVVEAFAVEDGGLLWSTPMHAGWNAAVVTDGRVFLASVDGHLYALDAATGAAPPLPARFILEPLLAFAAVVAAVAALAGLVAWGSRRATLRAPKPRPQPVRGLAGWLALLAILLGIGVPMLLRSLLELAGWHQVLQGATLGGPASLVGQILSPATLAILWLGAWVLRSTGNPPLRTSRRAAVLVAAVVAPVWALIGYVASSFCFFMCTPVSPWIPILHGVVAAAGLALGCLAAGWSAQRSLPCQGPTDELLEGRCRLGEFLVTVGGLYLMLWPFAAFWLPMDSFEISWGKSVANFLPSVPAALASAAIGALIIRESSDPQKEALRAGIVLGVAWGILRFAFFPLVEPDGHVMMDALASSIMLCLACALAGVLAKLAKARGMVSPPGAFRQRF